MKHSDWSFIFSPASFASSRVLRAGIVVFAFGAGGCDTQTTPELVENGYPTLARVEYVLQCMEQHGGQNLDTLYPCVCSIDKIATQLPYDDYAEAQTFTAMRSAPGEGGGVFRDPPRATELRKKLEEAESFAQKSCYVKPGKADAS
ncbi:MAG: hypothetical protein ACU843_03200 [Gammaproteobacteria bacterium]